MQQTNTQARRVLNRAGLAFCLYFLLSQLVPTALMGLLEALAPDVAKQQLTQALLMTLCGYAVGLPPAWLVLRTAGQPSRTPEKHDLTTGEFLMYGVMSIGAMFLFNLVGTGINALMGLLKGSESVNVVNTLLNFDLPVLALMTIVFAPVAEELVFRGALWRYAGALGKRGYVFVSATLFMLMHGNIVQYPYTFVLGLLFAVVYVRTGRILYSIALHVLVNTIGGVVASVAVSNYLVAAVLGWTYILCAVGAVVLVIRRRDLLTLPASQNAETLVHDAMHSPGMILAAALSLVCAGLIIIFA